MGSIPSRVEVGPFSYNVSAAYEQIAKARYEEGECHLTGNTHFARLQIVLDPSMPRDRQACTLLHEVLHGIWQLVGLPFGKLEQDADETVIKVMAPALLDTLRRNPDMVAFLTGDSDDG